MDVDSMTCDELKSEIIRMVNEIDDEHFLKEIYHTFRKYLGLEQTKDYKGKAAGVYMSYREKIIRLLDRIEESRLKELYNIMIYYYLKSPKV